MRDSISKTTEDTLSFRDRPVGQIQSLKGSDAIRITQKHYLQLELTRLVVSRYRSLVFTHSLTFYFNGTRKHYCRFQRFLVDLTHGIFRPHQNTYKHYGIFSSILGRFNASSFLALFQI